MMEKGTSNKEQYGIECTNKGRINCGKILQLQNYRLILDLCVRNDLYWLLTEINTFDHALYPIHTIRCREVYVKEIEKKRKSERKGHSEQTKTISAHQHYKYLFSKPDSTGYFFVFE